MSAHFETKEMVRFRSIYIAAAMRDRKDTAI